MPALRTLASASLRRAAARPGPPGRRCLAAAAAAGPPPPPPPPAHDGLLRLYNTLTRSKEGNRVSMYVCGVTVYDYSHVGHARAYVAFDVLLRTLRSRGLDVAYARNFTDVDDKIIRRAQEQGVTCDALTRRFISEFWADMAALRCLEPTHEPRATGYVPEVVAMVERILANGHAYALPGGDVYFEVASLPSYGRLSGRGGGDNRAGERVAVDGRKRGAADFALWKAAKPGEPSWESPWGRGRPGWHIECSAMAAALFGPTVDLHGGGADLLFPHHENEVAQSAAAAAPCGCCASPAHASESAAALSSPSPSLSPSPQQQQPPPLARFWLHNGFVTAPGGDKMSKSLGNFATIRQALARHAPSALRLLLVGTHYRSPVAYGDAAVEEAGERAFYIYSTLQAADALAATAAATATAAAAAGGGGGQSDEACARALAPALAAAAALPPAVHAALSDDLATPAAVAALSPALRWVNELAAAAAAAAAATAGAGRRGGSGGPLGATTPAGRAAAAAALAAALRSALDAVGLSDGGDPASELAPLRAAALVRAGLTRSDLDARLAERAAARAAGDYAAADAVRGWLAERGIALTDGKGGGGGGDAGWRPAVAPAGAAAQQQQQQQQQQRQQEHQH